VSEEPCVVWLLLGCWMCQGSRAAVSEEAALVSCAVAVVAVVSCALVVCSGVEEDNLWAFWLTNKKAYAEVGLHLARLGAQLAEDIGTVALECGVLHVYVCGVRCFHVRTDIHECV
jgi:hypothetical protein